MIVVDNIVKRFGGIEAIAGASFEIRRGSITGLIGPNGAGKTTMFNTIAGLHAPTTGRILLDGLEISGKPPHELFGLGILRTFQIAREFPTLTVLENLMVVPARQSGENLISAWFRRGRICAEERAAKARAEDVLDFLSLSHVAQLPAGKLSGGQKKLLELGRTMMVEPRLVLLDEVGAGVNRTLLGQIGEAIRRLNRERGYTFCMIEHDMDFIASLCDPVIVMANGDVLAEGTPREILNNEAVIECYLGQAPERAAS